MTNQLDRLTAALADRYKIERQLGVGGMATVYLAEDLKHKRKVAVKVLRPELAAVLGAERFVQEITTTANLQHPHILPLFDSGEADGFLYYVMPFIDGETLRDKLNRETQLGIEEAVSITTAIADALDYAHRNNVIHRDIKPENILLHDGRPMVADFGIALAVSAAAGGRMTETGLSLGTPHYMSPEQATAEKDLTNRSDIYSLGCVLYEMLTGDPPHTGSSAQQIVMKIVTEDVQPVTELRKSVPPNVAAAVGKSLEKLAADRFGSAAEFATALADPGFSAPGTTTARTGTVGAAAGDKAGRRWIAGGVVVGLLAGLGLAAALGLGRGNMSGPATVRFLLTFSPGQQLVSTGADDAPFAISPDGSLIVYAAIDSGETVSRLYVRPVDQLESVPLAGTEDARAPFFSPDGSWIAFATENGNELKKVPVSGGPAITLADDVDFRFGGGTWGDDEYIVYQSDEGNLARVSGAGGIPEPLLARRGRIGFWPSALPGGGAVLAGVCDGRECAQQTLGVVDMETREPVVLVSGASRGWYATSGHLVFVGEGNAVFGVPFDPESREVTGERVPLLENVSAGFAGGARLSLSRSGSMIYLPGTSENVEIVELDRSGQEVAVIGQPGPYRHPRWSAEKDRIALTVREENENQIWVQDVASETLSQLTFEGSNRRPGWSPDGTRVAFYSTRPDNSGLYWMQADRSGPAEPVADDADTGIPSPVFWTRDGAWLVIDGFAGDTGATGHQSIYAVGTGADRTRETVVSADESDQTVGAVSPNGEWIAYLSNESGQEQVYVRRFMAPGGRWLVSTGTAGAPLWASDEEIVYKDYESGSLMSARLELGTTVRVVERRGLFDFSPYLEDPNVPEFDVSRDGQRFLVLRRSAGRDITVPVVVLNWTAEIERRMAGR